MTAEIITIGDELLIGQVINTNQAFIAQQLNSVGIAVDRMTTVGDSEEVILAAFSHAWASSDVVLVTGGLGPTHDDITRAMVCKFFHTDLVRDDQALENVKQIFQRRNLPLIRMNEDQAMVPRGCTVMQNSMGTAPGFFFEKDNRYFAVMPGVPFEMKAMMQTFVVPFFEQKGTGSIVRHRTLKTTGIAESLLAQQIGDVNELFSTDSGVSLAFLPAPTGVRLRITVRTTSAEDAQQKIASIENKLRAKASRYIYGVDEEELEQTLQGLLTERGLTIAVAESCTGGLISDRLTNVPGSSACVERCMVTYSNQSKIDELGVPSAIIEKHGAVSREVAEAMAHGIRTKSNVDIGLATTGIAGPGGGSDEKPVGLVWIAYSDKDETIAIRFNFGDDRRRTKERAAQAALELVRRKLLKIE